MQRTLGLKEGVFVVSLPKVSLQKDSFVWNDNELCYSTDGDKAF